MAELSAPVTDPTPIFEAFRGSFATELLVAAVVEFRVFERLARSAMPADELRTELGLAERPAVVLFTALRAMGLLTIDEAGRLTLSPVAREHLVPGAEFDVGGYVGLAAQAPGVQALVERLRTNRPAGAAPDDASGTAFIFRAGVESAMEREQSARQLTLALAGRARNVAPHLARALPLDDAQRVLDVGGGTGIYAIAWLRQHPQLRATVWDRPEVLKVAREMAEHYAVSERLDCVAGDMFVDPVPTGHDVCLLSNVLHDWDVPECRQLIDRCAAALSVGGRLLVHDVLLNDAHDGPLPIALYSASLFSLTEGRAYSAAEYRSWLEAAGLQVESIAETLVHCAVISARKTS
jgi:ubiquinone/menaquinone biosynthesis C-methylase UbiE